VPRGDHAARLVKQNHAPFALAPAFDPVYFNPDPLGRHAGERIAREPAVHGDATCTNGFGRLGAGHDPELRHRAIQRNRP
jgi:hypothetical protein